MTTFSTTPDLPGFPPPVPVIGVAQLNRLARELLERHLPLMWVAGELSNFRRYDSGHCYFTLKAADAQVDCVMFRLKAQRLGWQPEDGMRVEVRACPTLFEARGKFQLTVEVMRRAGLGALYEAYARLKARLEDDVEAPYAQPAGDHLPDPGAGGGCRAAHYPRGQARQCARGMRRARAVPRWRQYR